MRRLSCSFTSSGRRRTICSKRLLELYSMCTLDSLQNTVDFVSYHLFCVPQLHTLPFSIRTLHKRLLLPSDVVSTLSFGISLFISSTVLRSRIRIGISGFPSWLLSVVAPVGSSLSSLSMMLFSLQELLLLPTEILVCI